MLYMILKFVSLIKKTIVHHIYKTKGIILSDFDRSESNKVYYILTRDFGVLAVYAQSVRKLKSKLKYSLQSGTLSSIDMVRGKEMWRVTSAEFESGLLVHTNKKKIDLAFRVFALIRRFNHGEGRNTGLFDTVLQSLEFLKKTQSPDSLQALEILTNLRILHRLGYGANDKELQKFLGDGFDEKIFLSFADHKQNALNWINKALRESHL